MSTPTVLPAAALAGLLPAAEPGQRRGQAAGCLRPALLRAALYLLPVPLAVAASEPLGRLPWLVPAGTVLLGWGAMTGLRWVTGVTGRVLAGLGGLAAGGAVVLAVIPARLVGGDRPLAYAVILGGLALFAALAIGLGTGAEAVVLRWSLPAMLVAAAMLAGWLPALPLPVPGGRELPAGVLLLAAVGVLTGRALVLARAAPAQTYRYRTWPGPPAGCPPSASGYLLLGLCQATVVTMVWRVSQELPGLTVPPPALVPLLLALPVCEVGVGWYLARLAGGLGHHDDRDQYLRYARRLGWTVLVAMLAPLLAAAALAGAANRLPYRLSSHPDAAALALAFAGGVLLAGVLAVSWLLAARHRPGLATLVGVIPPVGAVAGHLGLPGLAATSLAGWGQLLPATVVALAVAYALGLVFAAHALFESRSLQ